MGKHGRAKQHHGANCVGGEGITHACSVGADQVSLKLEDLLWRDTHLGKSTETCIHPVNWRCGGSSGNDLVDDDPCFVHGGERGLSDLNRRPIAGYPNERFEGDWFVAEDEWTDGCHSADIRAEVAGGQGRWSTGKMAIPEGNPSGWSR